MIILFKDVISISKGSHLFLYKLTKKKTLNQ
jgi:hypothetical protein